MAAQLTDLLVKQLPAPKDRAYTILFDGGHKNAVQGFAVRVTRDGTRAFLLNYRCKRGRSHRYTIGRYPSWTVTAARDEAKRLRQRIDLGGCPVEEDEREREAPTVDALADRYLSDHVAARNRASSRVAIEGLLKQWIRPELGKLKVKDVRHEDADRLHRKITAAGSPYRANRALAVLSKMMNLAVKWEMRGDNPVRGVERNAEAKRKRYLTPDELQRLTRALTDEKNQQAANAVRLLLLTGARRGEVLGATWDQFDLAAGTWVKPGATTKQKTEHRVPLSAPTLQLLAGMRERAGDKAKFLFPAEGGGPQRDLKRHWTRICRAAGLAEKVDKKRGGKRWQAAVRVHDLRHSYASILASAGLSLPVIGALLGHTQPSTTARYAHLFDDPLRQATERVGAIVAGITKGESAEVVEMPARGKR